VHIDTITVGAFAMNCYLLSDPETSEAIYIDPGAEAEQLIKKITDQGLLLKYIINTHCHIDHAAEVKHVQQYFNIPYYIHEDELPLLKMLPQQGEMFGMSIAGIPSVDSYLKEGDVLEFGTIKGKVLHTPGHSPGGISLLFDRDVFVGDCLFYDSIGRTDLHKGDYEQLITSIKSKLLTLDEQNRVFPGHGPATTIGREKSHNPFLI
jgi:glyoxylase-like metal-dependent hydrolase (beta-lactamase superfamily II)